ncbi:HRDC domain-containing protein, partial [Nitratifractor sp.]
RGSKNRRIAENGHDRLSVYGIGRDLDRKLWGVVADRLLELEALTLDEYKGVHLTEAGAEILKGRRPVMIRKERMELRSRPEKRAVQELEDSDYDRELFETLRALRMEIAAEAGVPPYVVFSDKTLRELSVHLPKTKEEMLEVHGIGEVKFERYGEIFLEKIAELS